MNDRNEDGVKNLDLGCFALVMATGIVSIAAHLLQISLASWPLFVVNIASYAILVVLTAVRVGKYLSRITGEIVSHAYGPRSFVVVAATCVLGSQCLLLTSNRPVTLVLWLLGVLLWLGLTYTFWTAVIVREIKPTLREGLDGGWLVAVVATQSVSVLGAFLAAAYPVWEEQLLFVSLSLYLLGSIQYLLIIGLIFFRLLFLPVKPSELTPAYWINMGAAAISTLAGAVLMLNGGHEHYLRGILPFLQGFTLLFWVTATWWIPLLLLLACWRHAYRRFPIAYDHGYWNMVFPLGMYSTCTWELDKAAGLPFLIPISTVFFYLALTTWLAVFVGLVRWLHIALRAERHKHEHPERTIWTDHNVKSA
jgi:tellurite resistance protein TehA-like permease